MESNSRGWETGRVRLLRVSSERGVAVRSLGRIEVGAVPGLHWLMYVERVIRGPHGTQTDQLGRCYTWAVKDCGAERRLWRENGPGSGAQNETQALNFGVTCELIRDPIVMPRPKPLDAGPAIGVSTSPPGVSDIH